ncbi:MAG: homocysteine methyltransferase [Ectothiorhodospiraceae bacterium]|nr:homocysteine methyltransferase [Ectothiorhodospiraceae bacterium]
MNADSQIRQFLGSEEVILLDGAMGSELEARGVDIGLPLWSANALNTAPQTVRAVHADHLRAGADIITTNTFRTNRRALAKAGEERRWHDLNRIAVQLAYDARQWYPIPRPVFIAGSIAPLEDCYSPELVPGPGELAAEHGEQAELLYRAGVDFILAETMIAVREVEALARACAETGAPFVMSFLCRDDAHLLSGEPLADAVAAALPYNPAAFSLNCIHARTAAGPLRTLRSLTALPIAVYANTGDPLHPEAHPPAGPDEYAECAREWRSLGAKIIGGCCGTSPDHIAALRKAVKPRQSRFVQQSAQSGV